MKTNAAEIKHRIFSHVAVLASEAAVCRGLLGSRTVHSSLFPRQCQAVRVLGCPLQYIPPGMEVHGKSGWGAVKIPVMVASFLALHQVQLFPKTWPLTRFLVRSSSNRAAAVASRTQKSFSSTSVVCVLESSWKHHWAHLFCDVYFQHKALLVFFFVPGVYFAQCP